MVYGEGGGSSAAQFPALLRASIFYEREEITLRACALLKETDRLSCTVFKDIISENREKSQVKTSRAQRCSCVALSGAGATGLLLTGTQGTNALGAAVLFCAAGQPLPSCPLSAKPQDLAQGLGTQPRRGLVPGVCPGVNARAWRPKQRSLACGKTDSDGFLPTAATLLCTLMWCLVSEFILCLRTAGKAQ